MGTAGPDSSPTEQEAEEDAEDKIEAAEALTLQPPPPPSLPAQKFRSPRSYAQLKAEFKKGRGITLTKEESDIYWRGKRDDWEAEKKRHEAAEQRFWAASKTVTKHFVVKLLFYSVYGLWTATPIAGIVIGLIYVHSENCPGQPSIAPLLIVLGILSILVGLSLVKSRNKSNKAEPELTPPPPPRPPSAVPSPRKREGDDGTEPDPSVEVPIPNGGTDADQPPLDDIETGPISEAETTYTLGETLGVCAGGFLFCFIVIFKFAHLILFIATSVIVYRFAGRVQFSKTSLTEEDIQYVYCNEVLFRFAYWYITLALSILGLLLVCCCFGCWTFVAWTSYASREVPNAHAHAHAIPPHAQAQEP